MIKKFEYQQALSDSIEYFNGDELAAKVFLDKYALRDNQNNILENTPKMMHQRIAKEFARIESKKFKTPLSENEIFDLLDNFKYVVPQGSPMYGIGNDYQIISLSNCYVLETPVDSYSSILKVDEQLVNISKRRGGVGINLSNLRPSGTPTKNAARTSTGISTWMERYSNSIREVGQAGRRGALMLVLDVRHPDIETFITIKNDNTKVTGANISVLVNKDFMKAVDKDEEYTLQWPIDSKKPTIKKTVKAKDIWNLLVESAHNRAEPGILMWDNFMENGPADQYETYRSVATNPCAEISLCSFDSCRLIALNLFSYVKNPFTTEAFFDFDLFSKHSQIAERLMDDLVDLESEKIRNILNKIESDPESEDVKGSERRLWEKILWYNDNGRRTGLGITALGDTLAGLNIKYASEDGIKMTEKIYQQLKLNAYRSSVDMAKELGSFTEYDYKKEENCPFVKRIKKEDPELYAEMVQFGRRNVAILTTAPTGSVSIMTQTTSGIEPLFMTGYKRRKKVNPNDSDVRVDFVDQNGDSWQEFMVYHPKVKMWIDVTGETNVEKSPWFGCTANDINWVNRVLTQSAAQKHVCHSISSTLNLPNDVSVQEVDKIYRAAFDAGCKGITIYRDGCRTGVLVKDEKKEEKENKIVKTTAPKRPKILPCDVFHVTQNGKRYYVCVGLYDNHPYELFCSINDDGEGDVIIPKSIKHGELFKEARSKYVLKNSEKEYSCVLNNGHSDDTVEALTRMISTALRHGSDISFVVHQLEKTKGDLTSLSKVLARTLKKYIKDGSKVHGVECPSCKSHNLIRQEGCITCQDCGNSKCG